MKKKLCISGTFLFAFVIWTVLVLTVDVKSIGPMESPVGLATINSLFHRLTGVNLWLYDLTDRLSILPLAIVAGFAMFGLWQWISRRKLSLVDKDILLLGGFYVLVMALFLFFEIFKVNYRPVLIEGVLEASYPSSTTMLVLCVIPTAMIQAHTRIKHPAVKKALCIVLGCFLLFMVAGRLLSGVHWLTDIMAGALLSAGLVMLYDALKTAL